jgi:DUF971 family protein
VPDDIRPTAVERKVRPCRRLPSLLDQDSRSPPPQGNYAFAVTWSDDHTSSLYTYDHLSQLAADSTAT